MSDSLAYQHARPAARRTAGGRPQASYRLSVPEDRREEVERVHASHARFCPVARSLEGGIEVRTELELV
jgi:organic hydroperoxide reductase OsmC/OhrA